MKTQYWVLLIFISVVSHAEELTLVNKMQQLDTEVFDAFNNCEDPEQLDKHARFFAKDVEFYHDNGGVTWDRDSMIANTKKYVCGNYTRELVAGSLEVHPIKDYGAITKGTHVFCQSKNSASTCEGKADFVMVWHNIGDKWEITRTLSYGHRINN